MDFTANRFLLKVTFQLAKEKPDIELKCIDLLTTVLIGATILLKEEKSGNISRLSECDLKVIFFFILAQTLKDSNCGLAISLGRWVVTNLF